MSGAFGFDGAWVCNEHVPTDWLLMENMVRAAKVHDMDTMVRVRRGSYSEYILPLEMDATGIMVPHVMSAKQAKEVVWMTRFHPVGRRPVDGGNLDGFFCMIDPVEYMATANRERFVVMQIEDPEALEDVDAIAAVPGYEVLFFGPGDFAHGIGKPGQFDSKEVNDARRAVAAAAARHGKFAGTMSLPEKIGERLEEGFRFLNVGADVVGLMEYYGQMAAAIKKTVPEMGA